MKLTKKGIIELLQTQKGHDIKVVCHHLVGYFTIDRFVCKLFTELEQVRTIDNVSQKMLVATVKESNMIEDEQTFLNNWIDSFIDSLQFNDNVTPEQKNKDIQRIRDKFNNEKDSILNYKESIGKPIYCDFPPAKEIIQEQDHIKMYNSKFYILDQPTA